MSGNVKAQIIHGVVHDIRLSEPVVYVDNQARGRSGHMSHAMAEVEPGKLIDFNSNCSGIRGQGHSAFGWIEYRYSTDGGENFGELYELPYAKKEFVDGMNTVSVEKAVVCPNGTLIAFCHRNTTFREISCEPFDIPAYVRSFDGGKTWTEAKFLSEYAGRMYDAMYWNDAVYVLEFCNDADVIFTGTRPEDLYRLYKSDDNGETFYELSVVGFPSTKDLGYGNMTVSPEGNLIVYAYNIEDEVNLSYAVSADGGKTWCETGKSYVANRIRNPQVGILDGQYILHGRAGAKGFVLYTSADGIHWDEGTMLDTEKGGCYYSNNIVLDNPHKPGKKRMLVQYSESYELARVNIMHMMIETIEE